MTNEEDRLAQALRDERVLREQADHRAAQATEQAKIWRRRAEERAARIRELEEAKRPWFGRRRSADAAPVSHAGEPAAKTTLAWRSHPGVKVATAVRDTGCDDVLAMFDAVPFSGEPPPDADLVLVSPSVVQRWTEEEAAALKEWIDALGHVPLLTIGTKPLEFHPRGKTLPIETFASFTPGRLAEDRTDELRRIAPSELSDPNVIIDASLGRAIAVGDANPGVEQASVAARRWAYRYHHPRRKAEAILKAAELDAPPDSLLVSAALVSNRPDLVPDQIRTLVEQSHPDIEILVGLHGCGPSHELRNEVELATDTHRVEVMTFPESLSLGECLNTVIASGTGRFIAKIDDDDFYGPAYIEDAVDAFDYSQVDVVGKATQFTYLAEADETVLRRPGQEERLMGGTPTGASMLFTRRLWDEVRFPHRPRFVDKVLVRGARVLGASVYATSRWEFCYVRQESGHTWAASDESLRAGAEPAFPGFDTRRVVVADNCSGLVAPSSAT